MADGIEAVPVVEGKKKKKKPTGDRYWIRDSPARAEAKRLGLVNFMPERPCVRGHMSARSVKDGGCRKCTSDSIIAWGKTPKGKASKRASRVKMFSRIEYRGRRIQEDRDRRAANPGHLIYARRSRGLPEPTREVPEACECCGNIPPRIRLHLDHCHTTGAFRGWICRNCNTGIALLGDGLEGLRKALAYLERAEQERVKNTLVNESTTM